VLIAWRAVGEAQVPTRHHHALRQIIPWPSYGTTVSSDLAAEAAYHRFLAHEQRGDYAAAAAEATLLAYAVPSLLRQHALSWVHQGRAADAEALYAVLHANWPEDARIHNEWGTALGVRGDLDGAESRFRQALRLNPASGVAQRNLDQVAALRQSEAPGPGAGVDPTPPS
jgi:Flp pilus assembly protein TadD